MDTHALPKEVRSSPIVYALALLPLAQKEKIKPNVFIADYMFPVIRIYTAYPTARPL